MKKKKKKQKKTDRKDIRMSFLFFSIVFVFHLKDSILFNCQCILVLQLITETLNYSLDSKKLMNNVLWSFPSLNEGTYCWEKKTTRMMMMKLSRTHSSSCRVFIFFHLPASMTCSLFCFFVHHYCYYNNDSHHHCNYSRFTALMVSERLQSIAIIFIIISIVRKFSSNNRLIKRTTHFFLFPLQNRNDSHQK